MPDIDDAKRLSLLISHISSNVYEYISECETYGAALTVLKELYEKPTSEVFSRHKLLTCIQKNGESLDQYMNNLKQLSKDCNFQAVTANKNKSDYIRDAFISGISSNFIRQRLLENKTVNLDVAYDQARSLELAQTQADSYTSVVNRSMTSLGLVNAAEKKSDIVNNDDLECEDDNSEEMKYLNAASNSHRNKKCFYCGGRMHSNRMQCPAREATCHFCKMRGHYSKVCRKKTNSLGTSAATASLAASVSPLAVTTVKVNLNKITLKALVDTGSSENFIQSDIVNREGWNYNPSNMKIAMANTSKISSVDGIIYADLSIDGRKYSNIKFALMSNLCTDLILGHNFLSRHNYVSIPFGGQEPPITVSALAAATVTPPILFGKLSEDIKPIATKSRRYSFPDKIFIDKEINRMLKEGIIEPSRSPWRAQVLVVTNENHKKRLVVDYSQTINKFTDLDAFPLPNLSELVEKISSYNVFSTIDLKSAYHLIPILEKEKKFTAFEASGKLYQFNRIPFGVTNGVSAFVRVLNEIIESEGLNDTVAYLDDITVCGKTQALHDENLNNFMNVVKKYNLTINYDKCSFNQTTIDVLGYRITNGTLRPDPNRLSSLLDLPAPRNMKEQQRVVGMFAHYSKWIYNFSEKIQPIVKNNVFPFSNDVLQAFELLKGEIAKSVVIAVDENLPFVIETDASDHSIAAQLLQEGKPVAFFRPPAHQKR